MANSKKRKPKPSVADQYSGSHSKARPQKTRWWILALLVPAIVAYIYMSIPQSAAGSAGPQFTKEGTLSITRDGQELVALDIEIADTREDITQGMMYRTQMAENRGMLFLMEDTKIQSFWMLNTLIPLDIIFLDEEGRIINIAADTPPKSIESVSSTAPARYVLEVNGGYAAKKGLQAGDLVSWERL